MAMRNEKRLLRGRQLELSDLWTGRVSGWHTDSETKFIELCDGASLAPKGGNTVDQQEEFKQTSFISSIFGDSLDESNNAYLWG